MEKPDLTAAEKRVRDSYRRVRRSIGMPPTCIEIAQDLGITKQSAHEYMQRLEEKGVLTRNSTRRSRSLEMIRKPRGSQSAKRSA